MIFLDIEENKNEISIYKVRYINYKDIKDIKELSVNTDEDPYSQINFKEFLVDIARENICVWDTEQAILLRGLINCVSDKIDIKDMFSGEKMYTELSEMLNKYKEPSINIDTYRDIFNPIKLEEDNIIKMLNMYEFILKHSIYNNYRIFKLKKEILLRLECIKPTEEEDSLENLVFMKSYLSEEITKLTEEHDLIDFQVNRYSIPYRNLFESKDDIEIPF